jgi:hypothetical protein
LQRAPAIQMRAANVSPMRGTTASRLRPASRASTSAMHVDFIRRGWCMPPPSCHRACTGAASAPARLEGVRRRGGKGVRRRDGNSVCRRLPKVARDSNPDMNEMGRAGGAAGRRSPANLEGVRQRCGRTCNAAATGGGTESCARANEMKCNKFILNGGISGNLIPIREMFSFHQLHQ